MDARRDGILLVAQQVSGVRSGVGTYARLLLQGLLERGRTVTVATWSDQRDDASFPGAGWIDLGAPPARDPTPGAFWSLGRRAARALAGPARDSAVVHFLDAREAHAWAGATRSTAARAVGTVHDDYAAHAPAWPWGLRGRAHDPFRRWLYYRWLLRLERRTYPRFDLLLANSCATADTLAGVHRVDPARVRVTPLCIVPARPGAAETLEGEPTLLFAGGNYYRKGLDRVVRSLPPLAATFPRILLHVAGEDPARDRIRALARCLGVAERVRFHGRVEPARMQGMMRAADLFVMPSRREGLGLVYLEAFAAGTPVIAGTKGGVGDLVEDGVSGRCVGTDDPRALARAAEQILADPELRARLVAGGRAVLAARTPERLVRETMEAYDAEGVGADTRAAAEAVP